MISKELVGASVRPILLSVLASGDSYGYEIIQRVKEYSNGEISWRDGSLYPVLHRLEDEGLVESYWESKKSGRRRKYYKICGTGRVRLEQEKHQWLHVDAVLAKLWGLQPHLAGASG
jgi:PadR family transcriptional regulator